MSTGALSALIRYLSAIPLDVWLIIGIFILSFIFVGSAAAIARRGRRATQSEAEVVPADADAEKSIEALREAEQKYAWLGEMADAQAREIDKYVIVERVLLCDVRLTDPIQIPYVEFWLDIYNMSVYDIVIHKDRIEGRIKFRLTDLLEGKEIIHHLDSIPPSSRVNLTIKQRLSPTEINLISRYGSGTEELESHFSLQGIGITIGGITKFPQVERKRLSLPQRIGIKDLVNKDRVKTLEAEVGVLQSELDKLKTHKLKFDVDAERSQIHVSGHPYDDFSVGFQLHIRFENSDIYPLTVRSVIVLLIKRNEDKTESEIPHIKRLIYTSIMENDQQVDHSWEDRNLSINARELTLYHRVEGYVEVAGDYREILDKDCFLRVTMDAMNQPPHSLDFNVKWQNINLGWIHITPRT